MHRLFSSADVRMFRVMLCALSAITTLLLVEYSNVASGKETHRASHPNVLLIVSDDQRPDTLHVAGNRLIETRNLDRLAKSGVRFTRAVSANPICTPSRAEILTGASGFQNGVNDFGGKIKPEMVRFAQAMKRGGYRTCYVGKWHNNGSPNAHGYDRSRGYFRGGGKSIASVDHHGREVTGYRGWVFQTEDGRKFPELGVGLTADISSKFADAAIEEIKLDSKIPFFLHVNFTAPHDPLLMPPGFEAKYDAARMTLPENFAAEHPFDHGNLKGRDEVLLPFPRTDKDVKADLAVYYAVISHMDEQIGRIITALEESKQIENTVIIFTSDHGLAMGSHGLRGKQNMYEHTIGVPLIVSGPNIPLDETRNAQVYLRDIFPTVCELCDVEIPESVSAKSFVRCLEDNEAKIHEFVFCHFRDFQRAIRDDRWKLIHYPKLGRFQLFDLQNDPFELTDLSDNPSYQDIRLEAHRKLELEQRRLQSKN